MSLVRYPMSNPAIKYFEVLGLRSGAQPEDIKRAFKELAFQYHPDRNPHNAWAEEKFKEVVEAYSFLSGNMEAYQALKTPPKKNADTMEQAQDIYQILFDIDLTPVATRPRPLNLNLELSLEEAFRGVEKKILIERYDLCPQCWGSGVEKGAKTFTCTYCFGEGEVESDSAEGGFRECPKCNGRGFLSSQGCLACRAKGVVLKTVTQKVQIPPRMGRGRILTLSEQGHEFAPGQRGEVRIAIDLKRDPRFTFDGKDIICETTVEMGDAALGGEITVPTLEGPRKVSVPAGIQSGQVVKLKGLGLGGDQFIRVWVRTPTVISEKDRKIIQGFRLRSEEKSSGLWARIKKWIW